MKIRDKNPALSGLIRKLEEKGRLEKRPLWQTLAKKLNRPRRKSHEVNLFSIEKNAKANETVIVPGYVLGSGKLTKPVTVAALKFSGNAAEKIKGAKGRTMTIDSFLDDYKPGTKIRIMG